MFIYSLLLSVFAILILVHGIIYHFLTSVFTFEKRGLRLSILFVLFFLAFSFMLSVFLVHWHDNIVTKSFYFLSGAWIGFVFNLLSFIVIFWGLFFTLRFLNINMNLLWTGILFIVLAIIVTGVGVFNALSPKITNISVDIKDLPEEWNGKVIVQISDVHLGRILGVSFFEDVIKKVNNINPDVILITGDLFDGMDGGFTRFIPVLNKIAAKDGVFYVTGNHDVYLGLKEPLKALSQTGIKVLNDEVIDINGLQIIGLSYPVPGEEKNIKKIFSAENNFFSEKPSILMFHSPVNILSDDNNGNDWHNNIYFFPNVDFGAVKNIGIDLQLSGHTHKGQFFPFNLLSCLIFRGYDYGLHVDGDFSIFTSSGTGVWGPTMRVGSRSEIVAITLLKK